MASPICTVNGLSTTNGINIENNDSVTIRLADSAGVKQWSITCINTDDLQSKAFINSILSVNQVTKTATFTATDAGENGAAFIFESKINNGVDSNGRADSSLTTRFGIYILTVAGVRVAALDETIEGNSEFGWVVKFNDVIRNFGGGGNVGSASAGNGLVFSGGAYNIAAADSSITVNADSIQVGTISASQHGNQTNASLHAAATTSANGFMSSTDKTKLDAATASATASTLALRDSFGNINFAGVICTTITAITSIGTTTGNITTINSSTVNSSTVNSQSFNISSLVTDVRVMNTTPNAGPTHWECTTAGQWVNLSIGTNLFIPIQVPNGATLTTVEVRLTGAGSHAGLPGTMPLVTVRRFDTSSGLGFTLGSASDPSGSVGTFQGSHSITVSGMSHTIDRTVNRYYVQLTAENGANALVGATYEWVKVTWNRPATSVIGRD